MPEFETITFEWKEGVAWATSNRPNAVSAARQPPRERSKPRTR